MKLKLEELPDNTWLELIRKQVLFYDVAGEVPFIYQTKRESQRLLSVGC